MEKCNKRFPHTEETLDDFVQISACILLFHSSDFFLALILPSCLGCSYVILYVTSKILNISHFILGQLI